MLLHRQRLKYLWFILLFLPFVLRGQIKTKGEDQTKGIPQEQIVKLSPLALLDPFGPTFAVYFEHQLYKKRKWESLEHEVGYTFRVSGLTHKAFGYRLRSSYRHYFSAKWKEKGNYYIALALMHRQFFDKGTAFVWRADRGYQQNLPYHLSIAQQSLTMNAGTTRYFGNKDRFNIDLSIGLGFRRTHVLFKDLPSDAVTPNIPDVFERNFKAYVEQTTLKERTHYYMNTVLAVKLGYVLQTNSLVKKK